MGDGRYKRNIGRYKHDTEITMKGKKTNMKQTTHKKKEAGYLNVNIKGIYNPGEKTRLLMIMRGFRG